MITFYTRPPSKAIIYMRRMNFGGKNSIKPECNQADQRKGKKEEKKRSQNAKRNRIEQNRTEKDATRKCQGNKEKNSREKQETKEQDNAEKTKVETEILSQKAGKEAAIQKQKTRRK